MMVGFRARRLPAVLLRRRSGGSALLTRGVGGLVVAAGAVVALAAVSCVGGAAKPGASALGTGWRGYRDPGGWILRYPPGWRLQRVDWGGLHQRIRGAAVTNLPGGLPELPDPQGPNPARWDMRHLRRSFVAIQFVHETFSGGPAPLMCGPPCPSPTSEPDTALPLAMADAYVPGRDNDSIGGPRPLRLDVVAKGVGYRIMVWFGTAVGARDRAIAERIVASIAFALPA